MPKTNPQNRFVAILRALVLRYEAARERGDWAAVGRINGRYHRLQVERHNRVSPNAAFYAPAHLAAHPLTFSSEPRS